VAALAAPIRWLAVALVDRGMRDPLTKRLFARLHALAYWLGVARSGGPLDSDKVRVLCWHALADLTADPLLQPYGVPPQRFREQLETLHRAGWAAVSADEFIALLEDGTAVPRRAFLVTFDDCYLDLSEIGRPLLTHTGISGAAFAVADYVGKESSWDPAVTPRPLADWTAVRTLHREGWDIGAHSRSHPRLTTLDDAALWAEVAGAREDLVEQGLPSPRLFAYPYGEWDARVRGVVEGSGYRAAFTVDPGTARRGANRFALPRIEVLPEDAGRRLRLKVRLGGRIPMLWLAGPGRRRHALARVKGMLRPLLGPAVRPVRERFRRRGSKRSDR
jgi:peptidoglycan/xylan/chitin deacetylase (PgdA/CDA1 family)